MLPLPNKPKITSKEKNRATIEISSLYPGYGVTIGNALRRILLSSLEGAAITSIKIKGVNHEFSTIPNILEDLIEIIINLKRVHIKSLTENPITLTIKVKGEKEVTAKDIVTPAEVKIINKDQKIATITDKKGELDMEITVERGVGYLSVEQRQSEKLGVGVITIDAMFSPVEFVNFTVEDMRVGQRTDYNKLLLDIKTNGAITPQEALTQACQIALQHFQVISSENDEGAKTDGKEKNSKKETKKKKVKGVK